MMMVLLVAAIGILVAGVLAIVFGIPVKEFSFGNTLILAGVVAVCTGVILLGLGVVVRELKVIAKRLGPSGQAAVAVVRGRAEPAPADYPGAEAGEELAGDRPLFLRDQLSPEIAVAPDLPTPSPEETARPRKRNPPPLAPAGEAEEKPRRNLMFSSTSRKERERATARGADSAPGLGDVAPAVMARPPEALPPADFENAWPDPPARSDSYRRGARGPSAFNDAHAADRTQPAANPAEVTVLKSGVVDGMAYSLYSDGSIEAQMPEGMMRFASIGELRAHLDQRL